MSVIGRKVLVTGGYGFIGQHVVNELVFRGYDPIVFDHRGRCVTENLCDVMLGDVRDPVAVTEAAAQVDAVIHLAAVLGTQETIGNPRPAAETNILGALNVFEAVAQYELPAAYICVGNHWMNNPYSITKTAAERFAHMYNNERGTSIAIVRALNAYGPGQKLPQPWGPGKVRKIIPTFVAQALTRHLLEIYGDGSQIMDMIYVGDVAAILVDALEKGPHPDGIVYEAGTGRETSVFEIATAVMDATRRLGDRLAFLPMRPGEPEGSVVVADRATLRPLPKRAMVPLEDGLKLTIPYFERQLKK